MGIAISLLPKQIAGFKFLFCVKYFDLTGGERMSEKNVWILPVALVVAALVIVVGFNLSSLVQQKNGGELAQVQLPSYLNKGSSAVSEGTASFAGDGTISFAADSAGNTTRLVSVSGTITKTASPELAIVTFGVETLDKSASKSQFDNAALANKVMDALKAAGIDIKDIETASYSVQEDFQWNETLRKSESIGYRTTNNIQVKVRDLAKVGSVIDVAVEAGANHVNGVSFALTKETEASLQTQALQEAAANAKAKAQGIAAGLGISVGAVYSASESSSYVVPYYAKNYAMDSASGASAPTPVTPGDIEYSATVNVQFEIQ